MAGLDGSRWIAPPPGARQCDAVNGTKHLFVLRHAKSNWDDPGQDDHDRPLAPRGRRATAVLAEHLREQSIEPDLVLCSSARRTQETLEGVGVAGRHVIERDLYGASTGELLARLQQVPEETRSVMVIGHNPTMQTLVLRLASPPLDGDSALLAQVQSKFPTGALAVLTFQCAWNELGPSRARLASFVRPKVLARR